MKAKTLFFILRTLCLLFVLLIGELTFQDYAYSQTITIERCPDNDDVLGAAGGFMLISAGVTVAGKTTTSRTMRGLSFIIAGAFIWAVFEPESCYQLTDALAIGGISGGALGLLASWTGCMGPSPNSIPTWQTRGYKQYSVPRWNIGAYKRGIRLTYRF